jgi:hypothetical protein
MPDQQNLKLVIANSIQDLKNVRLPGLDKSFDKLTIGELVQLRPGSAVSDTYDVQAVTDNATINTSSKLAQLGRIQSIRAMQKVVQQAQLNDLRTQLMPGGMAGIGSRSAAPGPQSVAMPEEDVFSADDSDPFKA